MHLSQLITTAAGAVGPRQAGGAGAITVDVSKTYQTIDGFGFSEAFQRAYNIYNLAEPKRSQLVDLLFNTTSGAGFSIVRNGIGSSPNSSNDWMNTIIPAGPASPSANATYVWDGKDSGQLWVSQQAVKYGVKTFYANAWSAPGFMKTNGKDSNGGSLCGVTNAKCSSGDWRQAYADYLVKYIQFYQQSGVNVTHLGFLNEPDFSTSYASMQSNGQQSADFIKVLYPTLQSAGLSSVAITCCDATGWTAQATMTRALKDAGVEDLIGVITSHPYTSAISGTQPTSRKVWESEYSDLSGSWSTAWYSGGSGSTGDGYTWANNIYTGLTSGNLSAYLWWVATQDKATNNNNNEKLVLVDGGSYFVSKRLWAFAQYSRVVRPGAVRVGVSGATSLKLTAFVNADGTVAVVAINSGTAAAAVTVAGVKAGAAKAWITDGTNDMASVPATVAADGTVGGVSVPARGMASFVLTVAG
ncbi:glycoside hydrolase family 30 protein [Lasiosphaeria miniovina]|uniref:Glycoside hydrolase family 30 protein n=1 Tax=Lasiosphaeria miniovina TaxID=1954250 RepID=A0AA40DKF7_9PEZI|nr:glycoside hydrolase family 30 protein [Lasiosphaeria miniovina]KAK0706969.1 glycoside hydrolase family 30 protein [Lasiosphaeria miniovina]